MSYVLKRIDQKGGYVAVSGNKSSYTFRTGEIKIYPTREAAQAEACGNEVPVPVENLFGK